LLEAVDDVFVISKTGDELVLSFDALPELPKNKKYTFLLYADGYSKEMDINSGSPDAVLPLPFKAMKKYPYAADEQFPMTEEKRTHLRRIHDANGQRIFAAHRNIFIKIINKHTIIKNKFVIRNLKFVIDFMEHIRYSAAACQTDLPNPTTRRRCGATPTASFDD
jgi:hypothetical protein